MGAARQVGALGMSAYGRVCQRREGHVRRAAAAGIDSRKHGKATGRGEWGVIEGELGGGGRIGIFHGGHTGVDVAMGLLVVSSREVGDMYFHLLYLHLKYHLDGFN